MQPTRPHARPFPSRRRRLRMAAALAALMAPGLAAAQAADAASLPPVRVTGEREAGPVRDSAGPTGQAAPLETLPQSVSVVPREALEAEGARSLSEALRAVANVRGFDARDANNNGAFRVRGFDAAVVLDGVAVPGYFATPNSLLGVQRIDVVKGPSGTLQGGSQAVGSAGFLGGVVMVDTGLPGDRSGGEAELALGSRGERLASLELDRVLGGGWSARLVAGQREEGFQTQGLDLRHRLIAGTVHWAPDAQRSLTLRLRRSESKGEDYAGLPARGSLLAAPYRIDRDAHLSASGLPDTVSESTLLALEGRQRLAPGWQAVLRVSRSEVLLDQRGAFLFPFGFNPSEDPVANPLAAAPFGLLAGARLRNRIEADVISPSVQGTVAHGDWRHSLSGGLDWSQVRDRGFVRFSAGGGVLGLVDVSQPSPGPNWIEADTTGTPDQRNRYKTEALWLQDHARYGERLSLLVSLRHTRFDIVDRTGGAFPVENLGSPDKTTARLGLTWQLDPAWSTFAGWGTGVRVPVGAVLREEVKPEESRQAELGLRWRTEAVQASLALFEIKVRNALGADPANPFQSVQVGEQRSRGAEAELRWTPTRDWTLSGAAGWLDAEVTRDTGLRQGKPLFNVPRRTLRLHARHRLGSLAGGQASAGLGVQHQGELPADALDSFRTPSLSLWDAQLGWEHGDWRLQLAVRNLFDREGFTPAEYFGGGQVIPVTGRSALLSARLRF